MDAELSEINVTPFTDVLLVLLVIFMILAALVVPPGFERELPNCTCSQAMTRPHDERPITVVVKKSGIIVMDGKRVSDAALYAEMSRYAATHPHAHVDLYGDGGAPYQQIMRVLDAAKDASLTDVGFVTQ